MGNSSSSSSSSTSLPFSNTDDDDADTSMRTRVTLTYKGYTEFPTTKVHAGVKDLNLLGNKLQSLPADLLTILPHLQVLDVRENKLQSFPQLDGTEEGQPHPLSSLLLSSNDLGEFSTTMLQHLPSLTLLKLDRNNRISTLELQEDVVHEALQELDVHMLMQLDTVPSALLRVFPSLERLRLRATAVKDVCLDGAPGKLNLLDVSRCELETLSESICALQELTWLDAEHNPRLAHVSDHLSSMGQLRTLKLGHCALESVDNVAWEDLAITHLYLEHNQLQSIPDGMMTMPLQELRLENNQLTELPGKMNECATLSTLDVSHNLLDSMPVGMDNMLALSRLTTVGNPLTELPEELLELRSAGSLTIISHLPDKILDKVYLCDRVSAANKEALQGRGVTHVLRVLNSEMEIPHQEVFTIKVFPVSDEASTDLLALFEEAHEFMDEGVEAGGVVVHCMAGISRSATIVISYLMARHGMRYAEAMEHVKQRRPIISPNPGFREQLKQYEAQLGL